MKPRVFKPKRSRVYRGRYRLGDDPRVYDVPLHTAFKHVAEAKLLTLVREKEEELAGIARPKVLVEAARRPLVEHLADYVEDILARSRSRKHVALARNRVTRLAEECGWRRIADVTADSFNRWRARQTLSEKTTNEYLGLASAFFRWLELHGRATHNPFRLVIKAETRGRERRVRRALSHAEIERLIAVSGKRSVPYLLALYTGLRKSEIRKLNWLDLHLDAHQPFVEVRSSTTKNSKTAVLPLLPIVVEGLRRHRKAEEGFKGRVFRLGVPKPNSRRADLKAAKIEEVDDLGRIVDFHALRHTFATLLNQAGIPPRVVMELMRHSDMRLTHKTYTDATSLSLFTELQKLPTPSSSLLASPQASLFCPKSGMSGQALGSSVSSEPVVITHQRLDLSFSDPRGSGGVYWIKFERSSLKIRPFRTCSRQDLNPFVGIPTPFPTWGTLRLAASRPRQTG